MKKDYKLYNMIFPPFLVLGFSIPYLLTSIIGNFFIDSTVLLIIILIIFKKLDFRLYLQKIFLVYIFGFAADVLGLVYLFITSSICKDLCIYGAVQQGTFARNLLEGMASVMDYSVNADMYTYIAVISGIVLAAAVIFLLNFFVVFRKKDMTRKQRIFSALMLAVLTAPYTFLLSSITFSI